MLTLVDGLGLTGGGERLARETTMRLDPDRFRRTLCISRWGPDQAGEPEAISVLDELGEAGVQFLGIERSSAMSVARWWWPLLSRLRHRVDILHAHKFGSNVWGSVLGGVARTPVIVAHEHTWSFEGQPLRRLLDRELIGRCSDAFIAVSREDRRRMIEVERIPPGRLVFLPNGIPAPPNPSRRDVRAELDIAPADPVLGAVCTLRPQKALEMLVEAAYLLKPEFPCLRVLIVGSGEEEGRLRARIRDRGLTETALLLGHRSDVPDLVRAFDVAVCSSDYEGSPLSIMEYMAAARPVVATRVGGVPDLIEDGVHGLLVDRRDPGALAAAIATLLRAPERAALMGERGRNRQRAEFDIGVMTRRLEDLYEELYARSTRADHSRQVGPSGS